MTPPRRSAVRGRWIKRIAWSALLSAMAAMAVSGSGGVSLPVLALIVVGVTSLVFASSWLSAFTGRRHQRAMKAIRNAPDNRCKGCNADLWGLDVRRVKSEYQIKCRECGVVNTVKPPAHRHELPATKSPASQLDQEPDTRSFRIR